MSSALFACDRVLGTFLHGENGSEMLLTMEVKWSELAVILGRVVGDLVSQMEVDSNFDVQGMIEAFLSNEQTQTEQRDAFRTAVSTIRRVGLTHSPAPLWPRETEDKVLDLFNRACGGYREARWHLMCERAYLAPTNGKGRICGRLSKLSKLHLSGAVFPEIKHLVSGQEVATAPEED